MKENKEALEIWEEVTRKSKLVRCIAYTNILSLFVMLASVIVLICGYYINGFKLLGCSVFVSLVSGRFYLLLRDKTIRIATEKL